MANTRILLPSDLAEQRVAFFVDGLGLAIERSWDDPGNRGWLLKAGDEAYVEILAANSSYPAGQPSGVQLVLQTANVDEAVARLIQLGATVVELPEDKPWGSRNAQVRDPEGLVVNLYTPLG
jgi:uncharacterized protein